MDTINLDGTILIFMFIQVIIIRVEIKMKIESFR